MIRITDRSKCSGCTACSAVCPHKAISMKPDRLGFKYPDVDMDLCTDCGMCEKVCDFVRTSSVRSCFPEEVRVSAARNRDAGVLEASQSGGVFSALAKTVINGGGTVYGAAFNPDFTVSHKRADSIAGCEAFRGSKYVQSEMGDTFTMVRKDLEAGREVLFSGTPCQVAGLVSYMPERLQERLMTVDFICHGVPSPYVWKDYLAYMGRSGRISSVCFRDKSLCGWKDHKESFMYEDGRKVCRETFKVLFYKNVMLRHSCAACPYDLGRRKGDVVIADFWGVEEVLPGFDAGHGVSMVIPVSDKGRRLLEEASVDLDIEEVTLPAGFIARRNPNLMHPARIYHERQMFEDVYLEKGFAYAARRWGDMGWRYKAWQIKVFLRKITGRI